MVLLLGPLLSLASALPFVVEELGGQVGEEPAAVSRGGTSRHPMVAVAGQRGWLELLPL